MEDFGLFSFCPSYQIIFQYHIPGASQFCACTELQIRFSLILFSFTEPKPDQQHFLRFQPNNSCLPWYLTWKTLLLSCFNHLRSLQPMPVIPLAWLHFLTHHTTQSHDCFFCSFCFLLASVPSPLLYFLHEYYSYLLLCPKPYLLLLFSGLVISELCKSVDSSTPGSSDNEVSQARLLEWVFTSLSRGFSLPRAPAFISCLAGGFFTTEAPGKSSSLIYWFHVPRDPHFLAYVLTY